MKFTQILDVQMRNLLINNEREIVNMKIIDTNNIENNEAQHAIEFKIVKKASYGALNLTNQVSVVCERYNYKHARKDKLVSKKTQHERWMIMKNFMIVLHDELGFKVIDIINIKQKHVVAVCKYWEEKGLSAGAIQNNLSALRTLFNVWLKKPRLVPKTKDLFDDPKTYKRSGITCEEKSFTAAGINIENPVKNLFKYNPIMAVQFMLVLSFGLRRSEAIMFRPYLDDLGDQIFIRRGAKGGKKRLVDVENEEQREAIELAKAFAEHKNSSTIPSKYSLKQWKNKFNYGLRVYAGLTKENLGATCHSGRHEYANNKYEEWTGLSAPLRMDETVEMDEKYVQKDIDGRKRVSKALGHERVGITSAYIGKLANRLVSKSTKSKQEVE